MIVFFFQAEDGIRDYKVTGVQTCALPICEIRYLGQPLFAVIAESREAARLAAAQAKAAADITAEPPVLTPQQAHELGRSEEHTSELQSPCNLVCRLLLEKKTQRTSRRMPASCPARHS